MRKILLFGEYMPGVIKAFQKEGFILAEVSRDFYNIKPSDKKIEWLKRNNIGLDIEYAFSFDFDINYSKWCYENNIIYISWSVDSPHLSLYCEIAKQEHNRIFLFDYSEYQELLNNGRMNIYYLPLATDVETLHRNAIGGECLAKSDVSFMGNMYDGLPHNLYDEIKYIPDYLRGYLDSIICAQQSLWGIDLFKEECLLMVLDELKKYINVEFTNEYDDIIFAKFIDRILGIKVAQIERRNMCNLLSEKYDFALYSGSDTSYNKKIKNKGYINYLTDMPRMFYNSKINININMHCIESGIPLRVLDIMACEGFCLTNYQPEIEKYFEIGKELVVYENSEDMCEKISYYLVHEDERNEIATNGYNKVLKEFDYSLGIHKLVEVLNL